MTVIEILRAMAAAYKGFDEAAVAAMAPVFERKLERYQGQELANAWVEVASSFDAKPSKPYPLPADFEAVLPRAAKIKTGPALDREAHRRRKGELMADWVQWQRPAVLDAYGPRVAFWCEDLVRTKADLLAWSLDSPEVIRLKEEEIVKVYQSVVSRDRVDAFGAATLGNKRLYDAWAEQWGQCREHVLAGRYSEEEIAKRVPNAKPKAAGPIFEGEFTEAPPPWLEDGAPEPAEVPE